MLMFNKIYFDKDRLTPKQKPKEWNNYRIAGAKRAIKRQREKAGLFGSELMEHITPEQRLKDLDNRFLNRVQYFRDNEAQVFKKVRKKFKSLPVDTQKDLLEYWNNSKVSKEGFRFLSLITSYERDNFYFKRVKGEASPFIKWVIGKDRVLRVVEISKEEHYSQANMIDRNRER